MFVVEEVGKKGEQVPVWDTFGKEAMMTTSGSHGRYVILGLGNTWQTQSTQNSETNLQVSINKIQVHIPNIMSQNKETYKNNKSHPN